MGRLKRLFAGADGRLFDLALAVLVVAVVAMMILPLTPWLLDFLISVNLALSTLLLCLSLFIRRPLAFTAFPTLLLVATLYRLALNVASTRLILLRANAGRIIGGFGGFVVGGDILVGGVLFGILAMVLFLVITKGAERVAEVAARFTLDGLPGMQLAIDADLRAQAISPAEASRRRGELEIESRYYGALDGAMKFVRGDAIAALAIIGVNIVGGIAVGTLRHRMSFGQAIDTYGRLTVGDGLVTMIPALLISTAAGLLVTRVGQGARPGGLGTEIGRQLGSEPRALAAAAALMCALALVPSFPSWPFLLVGGLLAVAAAARFRQERVASPVNEQIEESLWSGPKAEAPLVLALGSDLYNALAPEAERMGGWRYVSMRLALQTRERLGLPMAAVPIVRLPGTEAPWTARLEVRRVIAERAEIADRNAGLDALLALAGGWIADRAGSLVDLDTTQALVDRVALTRPVLVRETVPRAVSLPELSDLLSWLVEEGISLDHLPEVLEAISRADKVRDPAERLALARQRLAPVITADLLDGGNALPAMVLDPDLESVLDANLVATSRGARLALGPEILGEILKAFRDAAGKHLRPVVIVNARLRRPLARALAPELPGLRVVAPEEIEPRVTVDVAGRVEM